MTFKEKVIKYLEDFIDDKFCDYATGRDIRVFVLPHIKSMQEDPISEDVVSAANHAWLKAKDTESYADTFTDGFKAGAQWQKEQMMKDAVDGVVEYKYSRSGKNLFDVGSRVLLDAAKYHVDDGDNVKLIIIKEDES